MSELERLVVVLVALLEASKIKLNDEARALVETIDARCESARDYHRTRRGVDALERRDAREAKRPPNYASARREAARTGTFKPGEEL